MNRLILFLSDVVPSPRPYPTPRPRPTQGWALVAFWVILVAAVIFGVVSEHRRKRDRT